MNDSHAPSAPDWSGLIAQAYAADATPPLTDELLQSLRDALKKTVADQPSLDDAAVTKINQSLDAFELDLGAVVGPRLRGIPSGTGEFSMGQRSEAGRPLRAYGGQ